MISLSATVQQECLPGLSVLLSRGSGDRAALMLAYAALGVAVISVALWYSRHLAPVAAALWRGAERLAHWTGGIRLVRRIAARHPRVSRFIAQRVSPGEYLGLHLTIGMLASLAALALFASLAEDILRREELYLLDQAVADCLHQLATPTGLAVWVVVSELGSVWGIALVAVAVGILLFRRREKWLFRAWLAAVAGGALLNVVLKDLFQRARPSYAEFFALESWSFPSGHAMGSLVTYGMVAYIALVLVRNRRLGWALASLAVFLIAAIGASRIVLGVHYLSDVLGGYAAGSVWLAACISGVEAMRRRPPPGPA